MSEGFANPRFYPFDVAHPPPGWSSTTIGEVASEVRPGFASGKHNQSGNGIPHIRPMNIDREGRVNLAKVKYVDPDKNSLRLRRGDLLFNNTNSPVLVGKTTAITVDEDWAYSNHMTRLSFPEEHDNRFFAYQLHYLWMHGYFLHRCVHHVNQASISSTTLADTVPILVAPESEQRLIADKLDELFSDLDAGVAALERAQTNLKRYRAAVLKAAVEGKLTEQWRAEHPDVEPASALLKRILAERRTKWEEEQLRKYEAKGKNPPKGWQEKYKEPVRPHSDEQAAPHPYWCLATVDQVSEYVRYGSSAKTNLDNSGVPVLRMGNIQDGGISLQSLKYLPEDHAEFPELLLERGDLLFNRTNSAELVGKTAVFEGEPSPCSYASYLIAARMLTGCDSRLVSHALNSHYGRQWIGSVVSQQVGQANVNGTKLRAFTFSLPPEAEQVHILSIVDQALSVTDKLAQELAASLQKATRLRQSVLKKAFEGGLVRRNQHKPGERDHTAQDQMVTEPA